jgi:hypothetical protein
MRASRPRGDVYVQTIEESVLNMNSRTMEIHAGWEHPALADGRATEVGLEEANPERQPNVV